MEKKSSLSVPNSIVQGPLSPEAFIANDGNIFPKMCDQINETSWELWYLDGISMVNEGGAFAMGLTRDARGAKQGGFRVEVHALFSNGTNQSLELLFAESVFVRQRDGVITGTWHTSDREEAGKVVLQVLADLSCATVQLRVPGKIVGAVELTRRSQMPMLPSDEEEARLGSHVHYLRGISLATATADLAFESDADGLGPRRLSLRSDHQAVGGMDRLWAIVNWPQLMSESYHLRASCGPYDLHVMMIRSTTATGRVPYVSARLYKNKQTLCIASEGFVENPSSCNRDYLLARRVYGKQKDAVRGCFRDSNIGYTIEYVRGTSGNVIKHWNFEVRNLQGWWNLPTSQPGPNGTGNSSLIVKVTGGLVSMDEGADCESYVGYGGSGQVELP
ncbi:hypothetical protein GGR55DRAFT_682916 [Xylaria sp. FL0064]|nr:hypothetical protein GGR55DRAFT_682916 [Xylaria sp. FL0064]